ncbi:LLM class flavin-dependent oxidoreductase [Streptomyces sp. NPDC056161]|uniref:LLM class flavin-dependent oxidoreductase n=1 Tax=Streptomyces sp. NPDC056161 TaxID=3345732 RepID=UPI0035DCE049
MPLPVLGADVDPLVLPVGRSGEQALLIDGLSLVLITIQDHPYQAAFDDTWTLLGFLAARSRHVTVVSTVTSLPLRPPSVPAKAAAILDRLSCSWVQLGLGAGAFWEANAAMGGPRCEPRAAVSSTRRSPSSARCGAANAACAPTARTTPWRECIPARRPAPVWGSGLVRTGPEHSP